MTANQSGRYIDNSCVFIVVIRIYDELVISWIHFYIDSGAILLNY